MAQEHTVKAFDEDITRLRGLIAEMGGLAEVALAEAMEALIKGNSELARNVIARDKRIDALEAEVDKLAVRVIALRAPMADDLREVIAALKIAGVVERIGDYAKNIAKSTDKIEHRKKFDPLTLIPAMAEVAGETGAPSRAKMAANPGTGRLRFAARRVVRPQEASKAARSQVGSASCRAPSKSSTSKRQGGGSGWRSR